MQYDKGKPCVVYHRYHIVWSTKYRFKVPQGGLRLRIREILRQVCSENGVEIIKGVLSSDHIHMFVSVPPKLAIILRRGLDGVDTPARRHRNVPEWLSITRQRGGYPNHQGPTGSSQGELHTTLRHNHSESHQPDKTGSRWVRSFADVDI